MREYRRISKLFAASRELAVTDQSKLVFFSDCHRGCADGVDSFAPNYNTYFMALRHYYNGGFTYFELGDGDELWVNRDFRPIVSANARIFKLLMEFYRDGRLFFLYGNHDSVKKNNKWARANLYAYYDSRKNSPVPMFPDITVHEGLVLKHVPTGGKIFLLHGHQADFFNDALAPVAKLLVRHVWRPLEAVGVKDPTSTSASRLKKYKVENILTGWAAKENLILIAGHTHRTVFPKPGEALYFNDGCCVRPRFITAIELEAGLLTLVKWSVESRADGVLQVRKNILGGPYRLSDYFTPGKARQNPR